MKGKMKKEIIIAIVIVIVLVGIIIIMVNKNKSKNKTGTSSYVPSSYEPQYLNEEDIVEGEQYLIEYEVTDDGEVIEHYVDILMVDDGDLDVE